MDEARRRVRLHTRVPLKLPVRVLCRESADLAWTERTRLVDVNQFGAGFTLSRPVEVGRLIQLTGPLPYQLRCFDHLEPMYSVWGLVRHVWPLTHEPPMFRIGVAFVGKNPPASYQEDPTRRYEPVDAEGANNSLCSVQSRSLPNQRREPRLAIPIEVLVEALDENGAPSRQEHTVTETISSLGACIPTSLDVDVGHVLRISSGADRVSIFAVVRWRSSTPGITRLGVEFVGERWPLQRESGFTYDTSESETALVS